MAEAPSLILPKGIVVNGPYASSDLERRSEEALTADEITCFWKVYTTTTRRLHDPTAERLENFWWRIWGSQQNYLTGMTIARLFSEISASRSFVPLRSGLNRYEGGESVARPGGVSYGSTNISLPFKRYAKGPSPDSRDFPTDSTLSAATPPPILKEGHGSSSAGPRPTARFASADSSAESRVVVRPTSVATVQSFSTIGDSSPAETYGYGEKTGKRTKQTTGILMSKSKQTYDDGQRSHPPSPIAPQRALNVDQEVCGREGEDAVKSGVVIAVIKNSSNYDNQRLTYKLEEISRLPQQGEIPGEDVDTSSKSGVSASQYGCTCPKQCASNSNQVEGSEHSPPQLGNGRLSELTLKSTVAMSRPDLEEGKQMFGTDSTSEVKLVKRTTPPPEPSLSANKFTRLLTRRAVANSASSVPLGPAGEISSSSGASLGRSRSQLTLLLEKDRRRKEANDYIPRR